MFSFEPRCHGLAGSQTGMRAGCGAGWQVLSSASTWSTTTRATASGPYPARASTATSFVFLRSLAHESSALTVVTSGELDDDGKRQRHAPRAPSEHPPAPMHAQLGQAVAVCHCRISLQRSQVITSMAQHRA